MKLKDARAELAALTARVADLEAVVRRLLEHPLDLEGMCQWCGDYVDKDHDANHADDCPAVKARALIAEAKEARDGESF
jgi:hypothetical protein